MTFDGKMPSARFNSRLEKIAIVLVLIGILMVASGYAALTKTVTIANTGIILSGSEITPRSATVRDIQEAVDAMASIGGGTVHIPEGNFTFDLFASTNPQGNNGALVGVVVPGGVNVIGAGNNRTILYTPPTGWRSGGEALYADVMFKLDGSNNRPIRISGILFQGSVNYQSTMITQNPDGPNQNDGGSLCAILEYGVTDFRIDHNTFLDFSNAAISCNSKQVSSSAPRQGNNGVIDHNIIDNPYKDVYHTITGSYPYWAYGIIVGGSGWADGKWRTKAEIFGQYGPDIVYIEDNSFRRCRHDIAATGEGSDAFYVARHNTFTDNILEFYASFIDVHPGARGYEAYDNTFIDVPMDYRSNSGGWGSYNNRASTAYSGSGLFYNNVVENCPTNVLLAYTSTTETWKVNGWWIWGNTLQGPSSPVTVGSSPFPIREGIEYFLRAPNQAQDGFTYTPFPYPFPFDEYGMNNV